MTTAATPSISQLDPNFAQAKVEDGLHWYDIRALGMEGQGWFLGLHCFTKYVKVAFFRGAALRPVPPGESRQKDIRYIDIHEDEPLDEALVATWIRQASALPGWVP